MITAEMLQRALLATQQHMETLGQNTNQQTVPENEGLQEAAQAVLAGKFFKY